ncbi:MAG: VOC family protein [Chitinophagaceae bacterium]|jgi:lactoylglutathione lyase|nr:VOC family protein [Chitinophagaceae bacterium]
MKKIFHLLILFVAISSVQKLQAQTIKPVFNHITIYVVDMEKANKFYRKAMLLKEVSNPFNDGVHTWFALGNGTQLHVVQGAKEKTPHDINIHLAFSVPSIKKFMEHLDNLHVKHGNWGGEQGKIQMRPDKVPQIYLQDVDGYWIEVNEAAYIKNSAGRE